MVLSINNPDIQPRIGDVVPITMRADYQLPWNRQSSMTVCGDMVQNQVGAENWRVTLEGVVSVPMLRQLVQLRDQDPVRVVTEEFGEMNVSFDQLNVTRVDEEKWGSFPDSQGPLLSFQVQSKEDTTEGKGIQFFNQNTRGASYPSE